MKLIKGDSLKKFESVYDFVNEYGGIDYTIDKVQHYSKNATNAISKFPQSEEKNSLIRLIDFVSMREY